MKKYLLFFIAVGIIPALLHIIAPYNILPPALTFSDIALFSDKATSGGWFYLDKNIEYPILTGMFVQLMGWLANGSEMAYMILTHIFLISFGAATTYLLWLMLPSENRRNLSVYWIFAPSMFIFMTYNFDMLVLFLVVLALYYIKKDKPVAASFVLALGFSAKLYPLIYLLPLLIYTKDPKKKWQSLGVFVGTAILVNIYFIFANFDGWYYFYLFNSVRVNNLDSIWTVIQPWFYPLLSDVKNVNLFSLLSFSMAYFYVIFRYIRKVDIITLFFWITLLYAITVKVFTPQHILWLLPFFVLLGYPQKKWYYGLESVNTIIIALVLFFHYIPNPDPKVLILSIEPFTVIRFALLGSILFFSMKQYEDPVETGKEGNSVEIVKKSYFGQKYPNLIVFVVFALASLIMTWPLATKLNSAYPSTFYGFGGDPNMYVSYMDLVAKKFTGELPVDLEKMLFYPGGVNLSGGYEAPIIFLVSFPIIYLTGNPILAYNIILILAIVFTAWACYCLIRYLTKSFYISLICGFSFGFSSYMMVRGLQHLDLLLLFTVPFIALTTIKFIDNPTKKNIVFLSFSVFITAISAWYYLLAGLMFIGLAFLVNFRKLFLHKKIFFIACAVVSLTVLLPALPLFFNKSGDITERSDVILDRAGAQPLSFIMPHPFVTIWGFLTDGVYKKFPSVYNEPYPYFEQTAYFGIIGLVAVAVLVFYRNKIPFQQKTLWSAAFLIFMILALGNFISIGNFEIVMPFKLLREIFPFDHIRAPNRFFVFAYLSATVIFAYFLLHAKQYLKDRNLQILTGALLVLVLLSERMIFPYPTVEIPVSEFYHKLGKTKEAYAIVDIPIAQTYGDSLYNYYQIYHKKPIVGGEYFWTSYTPDTFDFINSNSLLRSTTVCNPDTDNIDRNALAELAQNNIGYVVVHNFILVGYEECPRVLVYVRKFFEDQTPVFVDGEITVYSTGLDKTDQ